MNSIITNDKNEALEANTINACRKLYEESVVSSRFVSITKEEREVAAQTHFMIGAVGALGLAAANSLFQFFRNEDGALAL